ncbi:MULTISPECIES: hypothetical protein [Sphingomonas]|jgi:hypothetical protein|uniref:Antifreeze protein n=1 Tax=Sphingomonas zeae TaxID=1646122 RepID=A0A7Y6EGW0_9SPHN|nr:MULTISPECIES: hypothetical protein [Sphingomonas]MBB4048326.1 putative membrane-anchored protein [Sphingomonas zeae]MDK8186214.1 hypothetical protein [Sphingomonas zeae]MDK8215736.1 hypothetical protein [Sphingomonas sp. UMB7805-LC452B]NUU46731.1 hypothetical protein [Sphingomonas zeae]
MNLLLLLSALLSALTGVGASARAQEARGVVAECSIAAAAKQAAVARAATRPVQALAALIETARTFAVFRAATPRPIAAIFMGRRRE